MEEKKSSEQQARENVLRKFTNFCNNPVNVDYEGIEKLQQHEVASFIAKVTVELFEGARYLEQLVIENRLPATINELQKMSDEHLKGAPGVPSHVEEVVKIPEDSSTDSSSSSSSSSSDEDPDEKNW